MTSVGPPKRTPKSITADTRPRGDLSQYINPSWKVNDRLSPGSLTNYTRKNKTRREEWNSLRLKNENRKSPGPKWRWEKCSFWEEKNAPATWRDLLGSRWPDMGDACAFHGRRTVSISARWSAKVCHSTCHTYASCQIQREKTILKSPDIPWTPRFMLRN